MSLHGYSDDGYVYDSDNDNVTRISKLDVSHPLHLHPNDSAALTVYLAGLREMRCLGIGRQKDGLYFFNNEIKGNNVMFEKANSTCFLSKIVWHKRLGHPADQVINVSEHLGDLVHLDLWGPYKMASKEGFKYFLTIVDDFSRAVWVYLLKGKDEVLPSSVLNGKSPFELCFLENFYLFIKGWFGCLCFATILNNSDKFSSSPGVSYDDYINTSSQGDGSNHLHSDSSTLDHREDFGDLHGSNGSVNEDVMAATPDEQNSESEDIDVDVAVPSPFGAENIHQPLRRSERYTSLLPVRCLINLAVQCDWPLFQLDINNAFLYGDLTETVYMKLPDGYFDKNDKRVCKLKKSLYGLKQAPRQWNAKLTQALVEDGFVQSKSDYSLFTNVILVFLKSKFQIKDLGKLKYFLGIEVVETDKGLCLSQRKYCLDLLSEFGLLACKPSAVPLEQFFKGFRWPTFN
ncbi:ribonuclease H-like domain-containing protein [Tanacetum coccineum]